jgi:hypothetical protein
MVLVREEHFECPFLNPARPSRGEDMPCGALYCRLPDGGVLLPSPVGLRQFCLSGRWQACPIYRRYRDARSQAPAR